MKVLVRGKDHQVEEFCSKFEDRRGFEFDRNNSRDIGLDPFDVVFDLFVEESPENLDQYVDKAGLVVFCDSVKSSLAEFSYYLDHQFAFNMIGFNGLPSFLERDLMEITVLDEMDKKVVEQICHELNTEFVIVEDRVGMVTPRVICMIINEAYYTVQEGTADRNDINLAMKLGTNYPYGPFEWAEKIGIDNVYELLEALYEDTKDERYKICPLLKREYMLK